MCVELIAAFTRTCHRFLLAGLHSVRVTATFMAVYSRAQRKFWWHLCVLLRMNEMGRVGIVLTLCN